MHYLLDIASGQIVGLEVIAVDIVEPGLVGFDERAYDDGCGHLAYAHQEELHQRDMHSADTG